MLEENSEILRLTLSSSLAGREGVHFGFALTDKNLLMIRLRNPP